MYHLRHQGVYRDLRTIADGPRFRSAACRRGRQKTIEEEFEKALKEA